MTIAIVAVIAVLLLGGITWGVIALLPGDGSEDATATSPTTSSAPATADPTQDPTGEPTDDPTVDPTDGPTTDAPVADGDFVDLTGDEPAIVTGPSTGEPIAELRLTAVTQDWQAPASSMFCGPSETGEYVLLTYDITTLPALAQEDPATYNFIGWELGALIDDIAVEANPFGGLLCLDDGQKVPSDMAPDSNYTGSILIDVQTGVTAVTFEEIFDFTGEAPAYRWVLADQ